MPAFGSASLAQLATCDPRLQRLFREVIKYFDCTVIEGHRSLARQRALYAQGRTAPGKIVTWVDGVTKKGMHNYSPARAADVSPYPIKWNDEARIFVFSGRVLGIAAILGIKIRWGGDWDSDTDILEERSRDLVHFEIVD